MPDPRPSQRKFTSPSSRGNVDVPRPRRPIPKRDMPLPGTKMPKIPTGPSPGLRLSHEENKFADSNDRLAGIYALLSLLTALLFVMYLCLAILKVSGLPPIGPGIIVLGLAMIHLFGIFSQVASNGKTAIGNKALLIAWLGGTAMIVITMILSRMMSPSE